MVLVIRPAPQPGRRPGTYARAPAPRSAGEAGYSEEDVAKIAGENLLRVWGEVERVAAEMQADA